MQRHAGLARHLEATMLKSAKVKKKTIAYHPVVRRDGIILSIKKLLRLLEFAVRSGNRTRAQRLAREILKHHVKNRLDLIRRVDSLLAKLGHSAPAAKPAQKRKSTMSAAGIARIRAAQKARWAKIKAAKPAAKAKHKLSAAAIAEKAQLSKKQAGEILERLAELAYKNAKDTFTLPGIGRLVLKNRGSRVPFKPIIPISIPEDFQLKGKVHPVWFATDRQINDGCDGFTGKPDPDHKITRGRVNVFVPDAHRFGETGASLLKKLWRRDLRDDRLRIQRLEVLGNNLFFREIQHAMEIVREAGQTSHALVYLHGYNVPFQDAAIRAAQLDCDLQVAGATAFFSWPSRGSKYRYAADEASIEDSEASIMDFLADFAANCGAEKIHIIAHSMGNRGLLRAMQRIAAVAELKSKVKFSQIFLAAPDVGRNLFLDLARLYPQFAERTTLYSSRADWAVWASQVVHSGPRAGYFKPYTVVKDVDTVAVPNFNVDLLGHSYYAEAEALLYDIHSLMRHNEEPGQRQRIRPAAHAGMNFWELEK
jgi:pimeloyl-ACP methyl ester carboxylesterase